MRIPFIVLSGLAVFLASGWQTPYAAVPESVRSAMTELTGVVVPDRWSPAEAAHLKATDDAAHQVFVHRAEYQRVSLRLDGQPWIDSRSPNLGEVALEQFQQGPPRLVVRARNGRWYSRRPAYEGALLEAHLLGSGGRSLELFRGRVTSRPVSVSAQTPLLITAIQPRLDDQGPPTRRVFQNMKVSEVVENLINEIGLQTSNESTLSEPELAGISQDRALWPFLVQTAERGQFLFDLNGNTLRMVYQGPPPATPEVVWQNMSFPNIFEAVANNHGFQTDVRITHEEEVLPKLIQYDDDDRFLFEQARAVGDSYFVANNVYNLREDPNLSPLSPAAITRTHSLLNLPDFLRGLARKCKMSAQVKSNTRLSLRNAQQQQETDLAFAQRAARQLGHTLTSGPGGIRLVSSKSVQNYTGDHLGSRLIIRPGKNLSFTVRHARLCNQLADPFRVATTTYILTVPRRGPAAASISSAAGLPNNLVPAGNALTRTFAAAEQAVVRHGNDPELAFLLHRTRYYIPSLVHYYALQPGGVNRLNELRTRLQPLKPVSRQKHKVSPRSPVLKRTR